MSTLGKVLVVLVALAIIPYLILFSMVYQLHSNWGKAVLDLENQIAQSRENLDKTRTELFAVRTAVAELQVQRDKDLTTLRGQISDLNKLQALTSERQERIRLQLESTQASTELAQMDVAHRTQDVADTQMALEQTRSQVEELKADVTAKLETLKGLQKQFLDTMAQNRQALDRVKGSSSSTVLPIRRASFVR